MQDNPFAHVPVDILPKLAGLRPYLLVILRKGPAYDHPDTRRVIQAEHLPYTFKQRDEGILAITMPVNDDTDVAAIGIYTVTDKAEAKRFLDNDPAVQKGIFTYEILNAIGMKGDTL